MSFARSDFRFLHRLRVRWAEVDLQKIVFNPHYLMYLDTALADYWRAMGLPYEPTLAALGGELFVKKATLEYHASAVYDDFLDVGLRCARVGNTSIQLQGGIFRGDQLLVAAELVHVFADPLSRTPLTVPAVLRQTMEGFDAGASVVDLQTGSWAHMGDAVRTLRKPEPQDHGAQHAVVRNRLGLVIASARLLPQAVVADAVVELPLVAGAGWGDAAVRALAAA
jgi:YbgC/YbaW family acyl-CoA thioester hydrolase